MVGDGRQYGPYGPGPNPYGGREREDRGRSRSADAPDRDHQDRSPYESGRRRDFATGDPGRRDDVGQDRSRSPRDFTRDAARQAEHRRFTEQIENPLLRAEGTLNHVIDTNIPALRNRLHALEDNIGLYNLESNKIREIRENINRHIEGHGELPTYEERDFLRALRNCKECNDNIRDYHKLSGKCSDNLGRVLEGLNSIERAIRTFDINRDIQDNTLYNCEKMRNERNDTLVTANNYGRRFDSRDLAERIRFTEIDIANVNRWRRRQNLAPLDPSEFPQHPPDRRNQNPPDRRNQRRRRGGRRRTRRPATTS